MTSIRELLLAAHKRAQDEAEIRRYELEEYERANGFRRTEGKTQIVGLEDKPISWFRPSREILDANRAYREVTGRDASAGAETFTEQVERFAIKRKRETFITED